MDYKIVGNEQNEHSSWLAEKLVSAANMAMSDWKQIRFHATGSESTMKALAYTDAPRFHGNTRGWVPVAGKSCFLDFVSFDGNTINPFTYGIIRKTEADSMATLKYTKDGRNFDVVGAEDYTGDNLSALVFELVDLAGEFPWREIRMDADYGVDAYTESPRAEYGCWVCDTTEYISLVKLKSDCGLNWQTFGIIRTEEAEEDNAKLSDKEIFEWKARNVRYQAGPTVSLGTVENTETALTPERTIADITNERIALLWTAIDELREWFDELETKTPDTAKHTLTPELIAALSDWPDSALETIAQAIADGRIVLGGAK